MEDVAAPPKRPCRLEALETVAPEVVGRLRFRRQRVAVEVSLELDDGRAQPFEPSFGSRLGKIVDAVVVVLAAEARLRQRAEVELLLVTRVEPFVEARAFPLGDARRRGVGRRRSRNGHLAFAREGCESGQYDSGQCAHASVSSIGGAWAPRRQLTAGRERPAQRSN